MTSPLETALTRRLGLKVPIVQAPTGLETSELVAAVCNAGALGMHALSWIPASDVAPLIQATRRLTGGTFGGNLVIAWDQHERLERALEQGLKLVSFFWGDVAPYAPRVHAAGGLVMSTVGSVEAARQAVDAGADILVAQGVEAGGHVIGEVGTMVLVPAIRAALPKVPLVAAGGVGTGRGLAAALCLGADAVWCGTRFVATRESQAHPGYKSALVASSETDTIHSKLFDGGWPDAPHRALVNSTVRMWRAAGSPPPGQRPGEGDLLATLPNGLEIPRYHEYPPDHTVTTDPEPLCHYAGQSTVFVESVEPTARIIASMASEAVETLSRLGAR